MRLFRLGLWIVVVAIGCKKEAEPTAGALRVELSYATFRPGCLTLEVEDKADPSRSELQELQLGTRPERSKDLTVAVFRQEGWSQDLVLTATAYERTCAEQNPRQVATQTAEAEVPEEGVEVVEMALRALDLDDDGYVRTNQGGSDCNDDDVKVNPGATDACDGKDDNCSGDESDAPGIVTYYTDSDQDGYGNPQSRQFACVQPAGTVLGGGDCNDTNAAVHPNQPEPLCNSQDENCNGIADETFDTGTACTTALNCPGALACAPGGTSSQCVSAQQPKTWYVDEDGDLRAGTLAGMGCQPPVAGAVEASADCDDSSPFAFNGGTERCDKLDNNCNGQVDESACSGVSWKQLPGVGTGSPDWRAVASYAEGRTWVAGLASALAHVNNSTVTQPTGCTGDWVSAWARPSDGRVFLGSDKGVISTLPVTGGTCETGDTGKASSINGMVGFESGGTTTLFAATSDGRVYRWTYPGGAAPVEVTRVAANLRDVHGTSPTNLLAVGAEQVGSNNEPRAFRSNPDGGTWIREPLPASVPAVFLRGVRMVHGQLAYAAGDQGVLLERSNGTWTAAPRLMPAGGGTPDILGLTAYGRTAVYAVASDKGVYLFNGTAWVLAEMETWTPLAIDGVGPHDLWVSGGGGHVLRWGP